MALTAKERIDQGGIVTNNSRSRSKKECERGRKEREGPMREETTTTTMIRTHTNIDDDMELWCGTYTGNLKKNETTDDGGRKT